MEVMVPLSDFRFSGVSDPASPKQRLAAAAEHFDFFCHYTSAPTSPTRAAAIYSHFNSVALDSSPSSGVPFTWEEKPRTPKSPRSSVAAAADNQGDDSDEFDFALGFSGRFDKLALPPPELTAADELFEEGKIRPLKPPPRLEYPTMDDKSSLASSSPNSPKSPKSWGLWSPRRRAGSVDEKGFDPFTAAMVDTTRDRGRKDRAPATAAISSLRSRKGSRSLSPLRGSGGGEGAFFNQLPTNSLPPLPLPIRTPAKSSTEALKGSGSKRWRLKDLLLFRSASEGRATGNRSKDPLRKYSPLGSSPAMNKREGAEDFKNSSFRRMEGGKEYSSSMRWTRTAGVTPHELHYTANRAAAVEQKKKTALPYRHSFFSFLGFNSAMNSAARGFGGY